MDGSRIDPSRGSGGAGAAVKLPAYCRLDGGIAVEV
jgi:hypothetical protein